MAVQTFGILRDYPGGVVGQAGIQQNIQQDTQAQQREEISPSLRPQGILDFGVNHQQIRRLDGQVQDHEPGEVGEEFLQNAEIAW